MTYYVFSGTLNPTQSVNAVTSCHINLRALHCTFQMSAQVVVCFNCSVVSCASLHCISLYFVLLTCVHHICTCLFIPFAYTIQPFEPFALCLLHFA